ncbi:5-amino-6-(5-phosphoribosylamino)uracil reductase [Methanomicrobiaceae archaeon CYW5]|uniref:RibD family protein n=1 Tax=Methanovulcanius yangii TaxID=1789227 RepID=UPI0029CA36BE|nr:RibD family protein [Methanovulcanius yangii]MBT8506921.1 5-amino-6-(5-phosphoribosylamino)uracil reductase [Methanovulcanius yangii]
MIPEVIIHNTVSLDNAVLGFDIDLGLHYSTLLAFEPDAILVGSATARYGIDMFLDSVPPEEGSDLVRPEPEPDDTRPVTVIVDSRGVLHGLLHIYRRMEYTKDVIVLVSDATPEEYLEYLRERAYPFIRCGTDHVALREALERLGEEYGIARVVSDSGGGLNGVLLNEHLADQLSLLVVPVLAGAGEKKLFGSVPAPIRLALADAQRLDGGVVHLRYTLG